MNKEQRIKLQDAIGTISEIAEEEQEKYDNAPENLQESERVEKFQADAEKLQEGIDALNGVLE